MINFHLFKIIYSIIMSSDLRPYFAKICDARPIAIARNMPDKKFMGNVNVRMIPVEKWTNQSGTTLTLVMIGYSKTKIDEVMMNSQSDMMSGPDMYHLYENNHNDPLMVIWMAPASGLIRAYIYEYATDGSTSPPNIITTSIGIIDKITDNSINQTIDDIWELHTGERWIRSSIVPGIDVDFIIPPFNI